MEKLRAATSAFDRERYAEARKDLAVLAVELSDVADVRELHGLTLYRLGKWAEAIAELEAHRSLTGSSEHLAVLADCYRARRNFAKVNELWTEICDASVSAALVAEGRIVAAGALTDQGDLKGALALMRPAEVVPRRPRDHHIKMWFVLGDLYDRSGALARASELFERVRALSPGYAGVEDRLAALGR